jgi:hypothetical protein
MFAAAFLYSLGENGRAQARNKWILTAEYCDNSLCYL